MIKKLQLTNFQSHKESSLEFSPGINVIIGSSDSGKSSLLRAMYLVFNNKPDGTFYISFWNGEKDKTEISIETESGIVKRIRGYLSKDKSEFNGYIISGKELTALNRVVPKEISDFFNLSDVNFQTEKDIHFLIDTSDGNIARYFNQLIKLDDIDYFLSAIDSKKRETKKDIEQIKIDLKNLQRQIDSLLWIDKVKIPIEKADKLSIDIINRENEYEKLKNEIEKYELINNTINGYDLKSIRLLFNNIYELFIYLEKKGKEFYNLNNSIIEYNKHTILYTQICDDIEKAKNILSIKEKVSIILNIETEIKNRNREIFNLKNFIVRYRKLRVNIIDNNKRIENIQEEINKIKKELPQICSVCGRPGICSNCGNVI